MTTQTVVVLDQLRCIHEHDGSGHSEPYVWPTLLWIDDATLATAELVGVSAPDHTSARVVVEHDMQAGDAADLPDPIRVLNAAIGDGFRAAVLVVLLWEMDDSPADAVTAGFDAFVSALRAAVADHLVALDESDSERDKALAEVEKAVHGAVESAITSKLSLWDKLTTDFDDDVGFDTATVRTLPDTGTATALSLAFGQQPGGQLLFYRDASRDGTGNIGGPAVIGQSGWQDFRFLFGGGDGIIYAVDQDGRLLFNRDTTRNGTGDVGAPSVIGQSGWQDYRFLFGGGDGIIYAVDQDGRLLFYRDQNQDGTGDIGAPTGVIGQSGWADYRFLFGGGDGIIYAVDQDGRLLFYRDQNQDGTGDIGAPTGVIGLNGWADYRFLFDGGDGVIYAVDQLVPSASRYELDAHLVAHPPGQIDVSPSHLDFGPVRDGNSAVRRVLIENVGIEPVPLKVLDSTSTAFSWEALQTTLFTNDGIEIPIEFGPFKVGTFHDALIVISDAQGSPHTIAISGSGIKGGPPPP
jgi:hypothetical protein